MRSLILDLLNKDKEEILKSSLAKAHENNDKCNSFVTILDDAKVNSNDGAFKGISYALKDNISTKGILSTASSNTLKNYIPPYSATSYLALEREGATLIGKTTMDEFGMGGTAKTAHTGLVRNPLDTERTPGGSSAGSAVAVSAGVVPFAIGTDTGDSIRKPASYTGIVGYKPTYGMISRYGLMPFASSLDHVGVLSKYVYDAAYVVNYIKGKDEKDMTSFDSSNIDLLKDIDKDIKGKKLFYIKEIADINEYENPSDELVCILKEFNNKIEAIRNAGVEVEEVSIDKKLLNVLNTAYIAIATAEATSNLSNMTGIQFGEREDGENIYELMKNFRTKNFSSLIKRRFVIGSFVLQKENQERYFVNAQRVRAKIVSIMNDLFTKYDGLILPASGNVAPKLSDINDNMSKTELAINNHMVIGNFGGYPSITIPFMNYNNLPVGLNITGPKVSDANILNIAYKLEKLIDYKEVR